MPHVGLLSTFIGMRLEAIRTAAPVRIIIAIARAILFMPLIC
jgi:hypothetical protein